MSFICGDCHIEHLVPTAQEDCDGNPCFNAVVRERNALKLLIQELAEKAAAVMHDLERHGGGIVPHLIDTDDNDGQYLRKAVEKILGPIHWGFPEKQQKCEKCGGEIAKWDNSRACQKCFGVRPLGDQS